MTGYGVGRASSAQLDVTVELRSVNHRHLDLRVKLPGALQSLQQSLTAQLRKALDRGHVEARVRVNDDTESTSQIQLNLPLAKELKAALDQLAAETDLQPIDHVRQLLQQPGILRVEATELDAKAIKPVLETACADALKQLMRHRNEEGERLAVDLQGRVETLKALHSELETSAPEVLSGLRKRLKDRIEDALKGSTVDPIRFEQEVVMLSDKSDITEELVRLRGHLQTCEDALQSQRPGKRLGFLAQELLREFNTIGSKSNSLTVTERVVTAKVEIEKFREQALNLA
tara:strand:+ start:77 stop:940 length:864 start_codon:yes stop_codon:yes gene_type:complete